MNVNRCCEGLRVIEEIARFAHDDSMVLREIKDIRHTVRRNIESLSSGLISFRNSEEDVGSSFSTKSEKFRGSFSSVTRANFLRAEEALRVIEEFGKLLDPAASESFKTLRFRVYTLERLFLSGLEETEVMPSATFLYAFVDRIFVDAENIRKVTGELIAGGADLIQYRARDQNRDEMRRDIVSIMAVAKEEGVPVIINNDINLCAETGAAGVHVGQDDMDPADIRDILGPGCIIGLSIHNMEELRKAPVSLLDYIAVSGVFTTATKQGVEPLGLKFLSEVCSKSSIPVVAIGGLNHENTREVIDAGVEGVAVISAILKGHIRKNCFTFRQIIDKKG